MASILRVILETAIAPRNEATMDGGGFPLSLRVWFGLLALMLVTVISVALYVTPNPQLPPKKGTANVSSHR